VSGRPRGAAQLAKAVGLLLNHKNLTSQDADVVSIAAMRIAEALRKALGDHTMAEHGRCLPDCARPGSTI
jgi:hypothetical protein